MLFNSPELATYVMDNFDNARPIVLTAFKELRDAGVTDVETQFLEIIYDEDLDGAVRAAVFAENLFEMTKAAIESNGITFNEAFELTMFHTNTVLGLLNRLRDLEDYYLVRRSIMYAADDRYILIQLLERFSELSMVVCNEMIGTVSPFYIDVLRELARVDTKEDLEDPVDRSIPNLFFSFMGEVVPLGTELYRSGYDKMLPVEKQVDILPYDLKAKLEETVKKGHTYAAIDILSVLMICRDTYQNPLKGFSENQELFLDELTDISTVSRIMKDIYSAFMTSLDEMKGSLANENNQ